MVRHACLATLVAISLLSFEARANSPPKPSCRIPQAGEKISLINGRSLVIPVKSNAHVELDPTTCRVRALSTTLQIPYRGTHASVSVLAGFFPRKDEAGSPREGGSKVVWVAHRNYPVFIDANPARPNVPAFLLKKEVGRPIRTQIFDCTVMDGDLSVPRYNFALGSMRGYCYSAISSTNFAARITIDIKDVPYFELIAPEVFKQLELD
jgi:hypothetical protein